MEEAKKIVQRSPLPTPRSSSPIDLPDITGSNIIHIIEDISEDVEGKSPVAKKPTPKKKGASGNQPSISISPPTPSTSSKLQLSELLHKSNLF